MSGFALTFGPYGTEGLRALQDAGVPTFGMLCPVFPQELEADCLKWLVDSLRPDRCERVWVEPYNERHNWKHVRDCFPSDRSTYAWVTRVYSEGDQALWSDYAASLYERLLRLAEEGHWTEKLCYLLYERNIVFGDVVRFRGLRGILLQFKHVDGKSRHLGFAALQ